MTRANFEANLLAKVGDPAFEADSRRLLRPGTGYRIDEAVFDIATAKQHLMALDPQAKFGISHFPDAEKLKELTTARVAAKAGH